MNKTIQRSISIFGLALLTACGGGGDKKTEEKAKKEEKKDGDKAEKACSYSYDHASTSIRFISFKHTSKTEVPGNMDSISVNGAKKADSPQKLMEGLDFTIFTDGINTKDQKRDRKIREFFFGMMENPKKMTGTIKSVDGDKEEGEGVFSLDINGMTGELPFEYTVSDNGGVELTAKIDWTDWDAQASVDSLQKACEAKHTGSDGKTKLWPSAELIIRSELNKDCPS